MYERFVDEVFDELVDPSAYDDESFPVRGFEKDGFDEDPFEGYSGRILGLGCSRRRNLPRTRNRLEELHPLGTTFAKQKRWEFASRHSGDQSRISAGGQAVK
jgi:hypothetical protein